jgi:hypothetical protein
MSPAVAGTVRGATRIVRPQFAVVADCESAMARDGRLLSERYRGRLPSPRSAVKLAISVN